MPNYQLPNFVTSINVWHNIAISGTYPITPPGGAPDLVFDGQLLYAHVYMPYWNPHGVAFVLAPKDTDLWNPEFSAFGSPTHEDLLEVPAGSGWFYQTQSVERTALGFANEHLTLTVFRILSPIDGHSGGGGGPPLLLEDATDMLLEDATSLLLE